MFRALCARHREVKIVLYSIWYHHTCRWPSSAQSSLYLCSGVPRGVWGVQTLPPPEIPKALQNRAKQNPICENC